MRDIDTDQLAAAMDSGATAEDVREYADAYNVAGRTTAWSRSGRTTHK